MGLINSAICFQQLTFFVKYPSYYKDLQKSISACTKCSLAKHN